MPDVARSLEREKSIVSWLNAISKDASAVYLLGDVFDFWFEYKTVVPKGFVRFLGAISQLTDAGIPVYLFPGNHDLWVGKYLETECGIIVVKEALTIELGNDICGEFTNVAVIKFNVINARVHDGIGVCVPNGIAARVAFSTDYCSACKRVAAR